MAEPSFNTLAAREKLAELMFEKFGCPALFLSKSAVLSAFAAGRGTALVLEMGGGVTSATAVHDGYALSKPLRRSSLGGDMLTQMLLTSISTRDPPVVVRPIYTLRKVGVGPGEESTQVQAFPGTHLSYHRYMQLSVLRDAKECVCRLAAVAPSEGAPLDASAWEYEMPDRSAVDLGWERLHLPELLFTPTLLSMPFAAPPSSAQKEALASMVPEGTLGLPEMVRPMPLPRGIFPPSFISPSPLGLPEMVLSPSPVSEKEESASRHPQLT
jgi:actin-like protein 6A